MSNGRLQLSMLWQAMRWRDVRNELLRDLQRVRDDEWQLTIGSQRQDERMRVLIRALVECEIERRIGVAEDELEAMGVEIDDRASGADTRPARAGTAST